MPKYIIPLVRRPLLIAARVFLTLSFLHGHESQGATSRTANNVRDLNGLSTPLAVSNATSDTIPRDRLLEEVQTWLSPPNPTTNHDVARKARLEGTARWFLQGKKFQTWKSSGSLLWVHGKRVFCFSVSMI
jgi:hypothetical protein